MILVKIVLVTMTLATMTFVSITLVRMTFLQWRFYNDVWMFENKKVDFVEGQVHI